MTLSCIIFGAIGALVETSDLQRRSFNDAFAAHNVGWHWDADTYRDLLSVNGGKNRIRYYAEQQYESLSPATVAAIHASKTDIYEARITQSGLRARDGVEALIEDAKAAGVTIGMASTTSVQNIDAIFSAVKDFSRQDFDFVLTGEDVDTVKPDPAIYHKAAQRAACLTSEILVIEDTPVSAKAASTAKLTVAIYPGAMVSDQDMSQADMIVGADDLSLSTLSSRLSPPKAAQDLGAGFTPVTPYFM